MYRSYTSENPRSAFAVNNSTQSIEIPEDHPSSISDVVGKKVERLLLFDSKSWFPPSGVYKDEWMELGHSESPRSVTLKGVHVLVGQYYFSKAKIF